MTPKSVDVAKDIARLALRLDHRFDGDILEEILEYCWDQLTWIRTDNELLSIRSALTLYDEETA